MTPGAVWRVLTGGMVAAIVLCTFAAAALGLWRSSTAIQILLLLWGVACLVATDVLEASPRSARRGAAGATSVLGVGFLLLGLGLVLVESIRLSGDDAIDVLLVAAVLTCGLAAWRWGSPLFVGLGGGALFCSLARLPHGRILWLVVGAALTGLAAWRLDEVRLAPSHRIGAAVLTVVGLGAVYAAANVYSLDEGSLEHLARIAPSREDLPRGARLAAAAATALLLLAVLAWGLRSRRTFLLDTGIVLLPSLLWACASTFCCLCSGSCSSWPAPCASSWCWPSSGPCAAPGAARSPGSPPTRSSRTSAGSRCSRSCRW